MSSNRKVTFWSSKNKKRASIETDVKTWGELQTLAQREGFDTSSLLASENINKTDLAHKDAKLPEQDFVVFFRPAKTKSGSLTYKEARAKIKQYLQEDGEHAQKHFNEKYGKNYTHMSTADLNKAVDEYDRPGVSPGPDAPQAEEATENVADVVESVRGMSNVQRADAAIKLLSAICDTDDENCERVEDVIGQIEGLKEDLSDEATDSVDDDAARERAEREQKEREEREAREREEAENKRLEEEFNDMKNGYTR